MSGKGNIFLSFLVTKANFNCILMSGKINIYFTKYTLYQSLLYSFIQARTFQNIKVRISKALHQFQKPFPNLQTRDEIRRPGK